MNYSYDSCANRKEKKKSLFSFLSLFFFTGFFEQWAPPYFLSCCEQCCLFEFPSFVVILKNRLRFINTLPLLTTDPLHLFTSSLLSLILKLIPFPIIHSECLLHSLLLTVSSFLKSLHQSFPIKQPIMMLAKGKGPSHRKGKEVAADDPLAKIMGKEAPLFKLDHSKEEEGGCNRNSKCPPLINPWYDAHTHFPTVPNDYLPLPKGRVWLSICHHDTKVSWAFLASSISNLDIRQGTLLPMLILFEFRSGSSLGWKEWVDEELFDTGFMEALRQAGVLKVIVSSHCLSNYRYRHSILQS